MYSISSLHAWAGYNWICHKTFYANAGTARNNNIGWYTRKPYLTLGGTASAYRKIHQGNGSLYGISASIIPNNNVGLKSYLNGVVNSPSFAASNQSLKPGTFDRSVIGAASFDNDNPFLEN